MPDQPLIHKLRVLLHNGRLDDDIDQLARLVAARQAYLAEKFASELRPGDRIRLRNIKPKYMSGLRGMVRSTDHGRGRIEVELDMAPPRSRYGRIVHVPASCVEPEYTEP